MATDATGTPSTNFSIPKYLTSADAPSGKGLNTIVDYLDTLLKKGFAQLTATGDIVYASAANVAARLPIGTSGQVLTVASGVPSWATPSGAAAPATSLPASPTDKQQAVLVDSTTAPTYAWLMQYSNAASKWIFLGGSPLSSEVLASENTASTTFTDLTTVGPYVGINYTGTYDFTVSSGHIQQSGTDDARIGLMKNGANVTEIALANATANASNGAMMGGVYRTTCTAGDTMKLMYRTRAGGTHTFFQRELRVTPVTVG